MAKSITPRLSTTTVDRLTRKYRTANFNEEKMSKVKLTPAEQLRLEQIKKSKQPKKAKGLWVMFKKKGGK